MSKKEISSWEVWDKVKRKGPKAANGPKRGKVGEKKAKNRGRVSKKQTARRRHCRKRKMLSLKIAGGVRLKTSNCFRGGGLKKSVGGGRTGFTGRGKKRGTRECEKMLQDLCVPPPLRGGSFQRLHKRGTPGARKKENEENFIERQQSWVNESNRPRKRLAKKSKAAKKRGGFAGAKKDRKGPAKARDGSAVKSLRHFPKKKSGVIAGPGEAL